MYDGPTLNICLNLTILYISEIHCMNLIQLKPFLEDIMNVIQSCSAHSNDSNHYIMFDVQSIYNYIHATPGSIFTMVYNQQTKCLILDRTCSCSY